ncbi:ArsR/SmtB family transcription factor [Bacillus tuaregi]|uniref:ArsR/SmtB family transcription factor n=1 Tax=Bacillus tuaregi TaxID=1816695 RepID=UPI0008F94478|nr:helix-turn-helix domain-containing protein [Bacillus tuaregi]
MEDIYYVEDLEQLKILSDPMRVKILWELDHGALTGKMLSVKLGLPASKMRYHLTTLEQAGLVEIERTEIKNGIVQKFYRPIARRISLKKITPYINKDEKIFEDALLVNTLESLEQTQFLLKKVEANELDREDVIQLHESVSLKEEDYNLLKSKVTELAQFIQEKQLPQDSAKAYHINIVGFPMQQGKETRRRN